MCHLVDLPARIYGHAYEIIQDDIDFRDGEPIEGAAPLPEFLEYNDAVADMSEDLIENRYDQELEWLWPTGEERTSEPEAVRGTPWLISYIQTYFEDFRSERHYDAEYTPHYNDFFMRRLLQHLPGKLDFDSWVAKALIRHVARRHGIPIENIHPSENNKRLTFEVGPNWPRRWPTGFRQIAAELDAIPKYLEDLAMEYAVWLPYEMQQITQIRDEVLLLRYGQGYYPALPQTLRPYDRNEQMATFILCQMHARLVLGHEWFDLAFQTHEMTYWRVSFPPFNI
ncbi:hypothetical protein MMC16_001400 [Acarospora aff. strigata]|nr:hypothetical protein [Acarospora aff. strigata]